MIQAFNLTFVSAKPLEDPLGKLRGLLLTELRNCEFRSVSGRFHVRAQLVVHPAQYRLDGPFVNGVLTDILRSKTLQLSLTGVTEVPP